VRPGYYFARASADETLNHRRRIAPVMHFLLSRPNQFLVIFQDEKAARQVANPTKKWNKRRDAYHAQDLGHEMGTGDGFNISAGLSIDGVLHDGNGGHVGYKKDTRNKANRSTAPTSRAGRGSGRAPRDGRGGRGGRGGSRGSGRRAGQGAPAEPARARGARVSGRKRKASARAAEADIESDDDKVDDVTVAVRVGPVDPDNDDDDYIGAQNEDLGEDVQFVGKRSVSTSSSKKRKAVAKAQADASSKESSVEFNDVIARLASAADAIARPSGRIVVIVVDGARTHTTYAPDSPFTKQITAWTREPTEKNNGASVFSTFLGDEYDAALSNAQLVELVRKSDRFKTEPLAVEQAAARHNAFVLILSNATPQWNPLEKLWRMASYHYSTLPRSERTLVRLEQHWLAYLGENSAIFDNTKNMPKGQTMTHLQKWFHLAHQHVRWAAANPTSAKYPTEYHILRQQLPDPNTDHLVAKFGSLDALRANLGDFKVLCHALNMYRRHPTSTDMWNTQLAKELKF